MPLYSATVAASFGGGQSPALPPLGEGDYHSPPSDFSSRSSYQPKEKSLKIRKRVEKS